MSTIPQFNHDKLQVYQSSIHFVGWVGEILEKVPKHLSAHNQSDRASTSIPLNIAEGNGKTSKPDRCRYFDTAHGSALECAACLDVMVARKVLAEGEIQAGKQLLVGIVSMLVGLIRATDPSRFAEEPVEYRIERVD
jgi:four helix bundle protein